MLIFANVWLVSLRIFHYFKFLKFKRLWFYFETIQIGKLDAFIWLWTRPCLLQFLFYAFFRFFQTAEAYWKSKDPKEPERFVLKLKPPSAAPESVASSAAKTKTTTTEEESEESESESEESEGEDWKKNVMIGKRMNEWFQSMSISCVCWMFVPFSFLAADIVSDCMLLMSNGWDAEKWFLLVNKHWGIGMTHCISPHDICMLWHDAAWLRLTFVPYFSKGAYDQC